MKIAIIITSFNRVNKTLNCLNSIHRLSQKAKDQCVEFKIYLTDDGSTDGTSNEVAKYFEKVTILKGNGELFWSGGMRKSWNVALLDSNDAYLLLNDDVVLYENLLVEIINGLSYGELKYGKKPIIIGATENENGILTYTGSIIKSKLYNVYSHLSPNGNFQRCDVGNANIMFVPKEVVNEIGIFSTDYLHGLSDYDYTLKANKCKIPVLVTRSFCGVCINDHVDSLERFRFLGFKERYRYLFHPKGFAIRDQLVFMNKHFKYRVPILIFGSILKLFCPKLYVLINNWRLNG